MHDDDLLNATNALMTLTANINGWRGSIKKDPAGSEAQRAEVKPSSATGRPAPSPTVIEELKKEIAGIVAPGCFTEATNSLCARLMNHPEFFSSNLLRRVHGISGPGVFCLNFPRLS